MVWPSDELTAVLEPLGQFPRDPAVTRVSAAMFAGPGSGWAARATSDLLTKFRTGET
jgi:hypothetical protein